MDAIQFELRTGIPVMGKYHLEKGFGSALGLDDWLYRNPLAPAGDRVLAQSLLSELIRTGFRGDSADWIQAA